MDAKTREQLSIVKAKIAAMLVDRQGLSGSAASPISPSRYWSDVCGFFDYMPDLSEEALAKLRLHTYHLTGDNYQTYYFNSGRDSLRDRWNSLIDGMPARYILFEPPGGFGFPLGPNGELVSRDILRYQRVVNTLHRSGILQRIQDAPDEQRRILEIGGGYGGLAYHLQRLVGGAHYVIVDLPETLLFSAAYLTMRFPAEPPYLYDPSAPDDLAAVVDRHRFTLIPNHRVDSLRSLRFDLVLNVASLQEMNVRQVIDYLDFIVETCTGTFYSWNQDTQPKNTELESLSALLATRFQLRELGPSRPASTRQRARELIKRVLRPAAVVMGLAEPGHSPYREYLCTPIASRT